MEIKSNQELSEAVGASIRQAGDFLEEKNVYMAENSNIPAVSNSKQAYIIRNTLMQRMSTALSQEADAIIGTGAAIAAMDHSEAVKLQ
ncbi:MAG: TIGR04197 family type VII secretion effector [Lachnospiraceae bacterium]|nr:TIGR04197 family type VII secretion effector [Lachnospiraceae bacterium]